MTPGCSSPFQCKNFAALEKCEVCRLAFYQSLEDPLTWEEGEEWRDYVLDTHYHPEKYTPAAVFYVTEEDVKKVANDV